MGKNGKRIILMVVFGLIVTLSVIAVTYAYYVGGVNNDKAQTVNLSTGTMALTFADNDNGFGGEIEFGQTITKKFTIQNTGTLDASASLNWFNLINTYIYGSLVYDLEYSETFNGTYAKIIDNQKVPVSETKITEMIAPRITVPKGKTYYYNLKVTLIDSETIDQTPDLSASFFTQFSIKGLSNKLSESYETLATLGLSINENDPDLSKIMPYNIYNDFNFIGGVSSTTEMTSNQSKYYTYSDTFTFDKSTGNYNLINSKVGLYSDVYSELVGKYIVSPEGSTSSSGMSPTNRGYIYKVNSATLTEMNHTRSKKETLRTGAKIHKAEDDYGTSYYFRGAAENNYVKFGKWSSTKNLYRGYQNSISKLKYVDYITQAECQNASSFNIGCELSPIIGKDMYWRIVRINGDGSLRLIYDGTSPYENDAAGDRIIGLSQFNNSDNDNAYVGYMYGTVGSTSYENTHTNINSSTIKQNIDKWYENNFLNTIYENSISDEIFCNEREISSLSETVGYTSLGYGTNDTGYLMLEKFFDEDFIILTNPMPNLKCSKKNDAFTSEDTVNGNGALTYPVGLLTIDETALAGGRYSKANHGFYLIKNAITYWLLSPGDFYNGANVGIISNSGSLGEDSTNVYNGVAPVINLSKEAARSLIGTGTMTDPFRLE